MPVAVGILGGAALSLVQRALSRRLCARVHSGRGTLGILALKIPLSLCVLALMALYSPQAAVFAAAGYTLAVAAMTFFAYRRRGE